jgi:pantetheine-phosphate adenylyltransferase
MKKALYPGSFDPVTFGHLDVIERALGLFDEVIVAVACNIRKQSIFSVQERVKLLQQALQHQPRVKITHFEGLVVDYARTQQATALLRGVRSTSDYEVESQMAHFNRDMSGLETVFLVTDKKYFYVSSRFVREIAAFKGPVSAYVPTHVERALQEKLQ